MFEIYRERTFAASHQLRNYDGKCERLHGHNWRIRVFLAGETLDHSGMLMDFHELDALMAEVIAPLDHRHLNEIAPFDVESPSSENLSRYIYEQVAKRLSGNDRVRVTRCDVWENDTSCARYTSSNSLTAIP